jgi:cobalamin biosynthesis Mg chelatase CobN
MANINGPFHTPQHKITQQQQLEEFQKEAIEESESSMTALAYVLVWLFVAVGVGLLWWMTK